MVTTRNRTNDDAAAAPDAGAADDIAANDAALEADADNLAAGINDIADNIPLIDPVANLAPPLNVQPPIANVPPVAPVPNVATAVQPPIANVPPVDLANLLQNITAALANFAQLAQQLQQQQQPAVGPPVPPNVPRPPPLANLFTSNQPFDMRDRAGQYAYNKACGPLDKKWDGNPDAFPSFVIHLQTRARECHWNAPAPHGITTIGTRNLFTSFSELTTVELDQARVARTNVRAQQNAAALYECLQDSITGTLYSLLFDQYANLPVHDDGPSLFKKLTVFTISSSFDLSNQAVQNLSAFDPAAYKFLIPDINMRLNNLFFQANSSVETLREPQKISHTLNAYERIRQPDKWVTWVANKIDEYKSGQLAVCQDLMNAAVTKYNNISFKQDGDFKGSTNSYQDDIVAMMAAYRRQLKKGDADTKRSKRKPDKPESESGSPAKRKPAATRGAKEPPFLKHFEDLADPSNPVKYKVGDHKTFKGTKYHFCDCPKHRDRIKWHTFTAADCTVRKKWLAEGGTANVAVADDATCATDPDSSITDTSEASDSVALLSRLMNSTENPVARDFLGQALTAIYDDEP